MKQSTARTKKRSAHPIAVAVLTMAATTVLVLPTTAQALTGNLHVDKNNASCSDLGSGTAGVPFCSISAAVAKTSPGATVIVEAGTYNEKVNVGKSGTSADPIVIRNATGATVRISSPAYGFTVTNQSWVTIQGFKILNPVGYGVNLSGSSHITVTGNTVTGAGSPTAGNTKYGIIVKGTTASTITGNQTDHNSDAGIALTLTSTNDVVSGNTSFANARQYVHAAPGIDVRASGNTIIGNTVYDNEDSGIQFYNGAANNVAVNNVAYNNGDHGIDALSSTGNAIVSNSIHGNFTSGITLETGATGSVVRNNIVADNGTTKRGDLWVDTASSSGTSLDYDMVNQSGSGTLITWGGTKYSTVSAFTTATGNEAHGLQGDPNWANPGTADFHLTAGSHAIDSADSGTPQETSSDMAGAARIDDPLTTNTGAGPRAFDDRGALEYQPPGVDAPPVAALTVTPESGLAPLQVTADASGSTDTDATPIATYTFDFGDGTTVGPQVGSSAQYTYDNAGSWTVTVTVTDTALNHSDATKQVTASSSIEYVTNPGFETDLTGWNHSGKVSTLTRVGTTSHGGGFSALVSNPSSSQISCGLVDAPNWVKPSATGTYTATLWVRARTAGKVLKLTLAETKGRTKIGSNAGHVTLSTTWQQVTVDYTALQPGHSTIGLAASIAKAPHGACFNADDASVQRH